MSKANDLIERMEAETGQRVDEEGSLAIAELLGAMSRMMGKSPSNYKERDDVVAGVLIQCQMSPEYQKEQEGKKLMAELLLGGMSPDDIKGMFE